jgi:hypothetical protein
MSASAYAKVLYGFELTEELLRVADGTKFECRSNSQHQIVPDRSFCPCCGSHVEEVARMVHSPLLVAFALKHGMSGDAAYAKLSKYQWKGPREWNTDRRKWVFGAIVAEEGTNKMTSFDPIGPKKIGIDLFELTNVFLMLGFNPDEARYILMVELS